MICSSCLYGNRGALFKEISLEKGMVIVALAVLALSVGVSLITTYLSHWTLKSSLLLGGGILVGGGALEAALFAIFRQKKTKEEAVLDVKIEKLAQEGISRKVFRVSADRKVYYIKFDNQFGKEHKAGEGHSLNDWLAFEIAKYLKIECVPEIWYFNSFKEFKESSEFALEFKNVLLNNEQIKTFVGPFVIQVEVECQPLSLREKLNYMENGEVDIKSAHEVFLSTLLMGNWDANFDNAPVDIHNKVQLIDNDSIGYQFLSLEFKTLWLNDHPSSKEDLNPDIKDKFLKIEEEALKAFLLEIKQNLRKKDIRLFHYFIPIILFNCTRLKKILGFAKTPADVINNWEN